nr:LuxR family transcriptional regulator [Actinomadura rugatobispora]
MERDADLAALVAALARPPALVVVEGEPGAGKTRLVREALADRALAGRQRLAGHAGPAPASCPLAPVIEALAAARPPPAGRLGALTGVLRPLLPDLAAALPPEPPPLEDPQLARHRLVRAVAELLAGLGPALLVLDDLRRADEGTVELLRMIEARPPPELSVVITCRSAAELPVPGLGPGAVRVRPSPLSPAGAGRLAGSVLGEPGTAVPRALAVLLHERSGGVPSVVCEDAELLRRRGLLRPVDGEWTLASAEPAALGSPALETHAPDALAVVPPAAGAEIVERARGLGAVGVAALEAAAVLAGAAEPELVARVAGMDAERACAALGDAARRGLLRDHGPDAATVRFRHELARLAVYQAIPGYRRRRLHAVAARELLRTRRGALAVPAAEHHKRAGDVRAWVESAEAVAELAAADGAFEAAHACLREVLQSDAVAADRRAGLAVKLGWAAAGGVDRSGTTASLLGAVRERGSGSAAQRAELLLLHAWSSVESAVPRRETESVVAGLRAALGDFTGRPDLRAIALAVLALPDRPPGRDLPARTADLSEARAALAETADPMAHAVVQITTARLLLTLGSPAAGHAIAALPARGDRPEVNRQLIRGLLDLAEAAVHLGQHARGLELAERGRRLAAEVRSRTYERSLLAVTLRARWTTGDLGAEEQAGLADGEPPVRGTLHPPYHLHPRLLAARIAAGQGRLDAARRTFRAVAEDACRDGELALAADAAAEFNRVALTGAHRRDGHELAVQVLNELARGRLWIWAAPLLPFAPVDLVRAVLPRYRGALAGRDAPLARAALGFAEARAHERHGDPGRAAAGYRRARHWYAALPDPRMAAHAGAAEVRAQIAAGQAPDAEVLRQAWSTFTGLGAVWDANRLKQLMRAAGLPVPHRRGRPGYGNELSPREREVVGLAASGHTNRDIAADLCLSDRTVKFHLANAMRKLEVSSRRQLRDVLEDAPRDGARRDEVRRDDVRRDHVCRCASCGRRLNPS